MELLLQINLIESQLKNRVTDFKLSVNELDTSVKEVSKEILLDFKNSEKYNNDIMNNICK